jgi:hypothetical protein
MTSRLTVVTGPPGVDIGPVAARLGRGLDDGFAIRVVRSDADSAPHTSPDPHHRHVGDPRIAQAPGSIGAVRLSVLPSAWQDPQTNLGVVWTGVPDLGLVEDIRTLDALGLNPAHRVTVQHGNPWRRWPLSIPEPVEVGNVGVQARDAVLRAGGRVLVEAGDGQTFLQALTTVGIPPWASWIGHLDRWIVIDAADGSDDLVGDPATLAAVLPGAVQRHVEQLDGSSGAYGGIGGMPTLKVALMNAQLLIPGIAAHDYNVATSDGDEPSEEARAALCTLLDAVADRTGVEVHLIGTGRIDGTGVWSWIDSGEHGNEDTWGL